jgi:hypothetical protein
MFQQLATDDWLRGQTTQRQRWGLRKAWRTGRTLSGCRRAERRVQSAVPSAQQRWASGGVGWTDGWAARSPTWEMRGARVSIWRPVTRAHGLVRDDGGAGGRRGGGLCYTDTDTSIGYNTHPVRDTLFSKKQWHGDTTKIFFNNNNNNMI